MLRAGQVGLRARDEADVAVLHAELYEDIATRVRADSRPWRPIPANSAASPYAVSEPRDDHAVFSVVELAGGELAGEALLWAIDLHNRTAHVGLSLRPAFRRQEMYQTDRGAPPDGQFSPGNLSCLVPGNHGRLLDARRTPVRVTAIDIHHGYFEMEILAFEDKGARWLIPLEEVTHYQFALDSVRADAVAVASMKDIIRQLDVTVEITVHEESHRESMQKIAAERVRADAWLTAHGVPDKIDVTANIASRRGSPEAVRWLADYLAECVPAGLPDMDQHLAASYISNPGSGDLVRAHLITAARLGLCGYEGKAIRDTSSLSGKWTEERRAAHIIIRTGFVQALWIRAAHPRLMIYRGIGLLGDAELEASGVALMSATLSRAVAESHFNSEPSPAAALLRGQLPIERLFMTFLETSAMNDKYLEAEAVLFGNGRLI
jgi:hypothetical protein